MGFEIPNRFGDGTLSAVVEDHHSAVFEKTVSVEEVDKDVVEVVIAVDEDEIKFFAAGEEPRQGLERGLPDHGQKAAVPGPLDVVNSDCSPVGRLKGIDRGKRASSRGGDSVGEMHARGAESHADLEDAGRVEARDLFGESFTEFPADAGFVSDGLSVARLDGSITPDLIEKRVRHSVSFYLTITSLL